MAQRTHHMGVITAVTAATAPASDRPGFLLHRVKCPKCGQSVWFTLRADCSPEEVDMARRRQAARLLHEPCDQHGGPAVR